MVWGTEVTLGLRETVVWGMEVTLRVGEPHDTGGGGRPGIWGQRCLVKWRSPWSWGTSWSKGQEVALCLGEPMVWGMEVTLDWGTPL